jgi:hypothetical protein
MKVIPPSFMLTNNLQIVVKYRVYEIKFVVILTAINHFELIKVLLIRLQVILNSHV